jgi:F0F1-type ATP synthase assembly protein I
MNKQIKKLKNSKCFNISMKKEAKKIGKYPRGFWMASGILIGIVIGIPVGILVKDFAIGACTGVSLGLAMGASLEFKNKRNAVPLIEKKGTRRKRK